MAAISPVDETGNLEPSRNGQHEGRHAIALKWSELIIKWLTIIATLIGTYVTVGQFNHTRAREIDEANATRRQEITATAKEYQSAFYEKQFNTYLNATQDASILATSLDADER